MLGPATKQLRCPYGERLCPFPERLVIKTTTPAHAWQIDSIQPFLLTPSFLVTQNFCFLFPAAKYFCNQRTSAARPQLTTVSTVTLAGTLGISFISAPHTPVCELHRRCHFLPPCGKHMCMKSRVPAPVWGPAFLKLPLCIEAEWLQQRFAMRTPIVPHGLVLLSLPPPPSRNLPLAVPHGGSLTLGFSLAGYVDEELSPKPDPQLSCQHYVSSGRGCMWWMSVSAGLTHLTHFQKQKDIATRERWRCTLLGGCCETIMMQGWASELACLCRCPGSPQSDAMGSCSKCFFFLCTCH